MNKIKGSGGGGGCWLSCARALRLKWYLAKDKVTMDSCEKVAGR